MKLLVTLLLCNLLVQSLVSGECHFPAIFNFGDSNSDTGELAATLLRLGPPNGETFFGATMGRFSDGRLVIDFAAKSLGLPYLSAYLDSVGTNFSHGANFATALSTIQLPNNAFHFGGPTPFSLDVQTLQFSMFKQRSQRVRDRVGGIYKHMLPAEDYFHRGLYTLDIGQNDLTAVFFLNMPTQEVMAYVKGLINNFITAIKSIYAEGGRYFWIHNTGPFGCLSYVLTQVPLGKDQYDQAGCGIPFNQVAMLFNKLLKEAVAQLRKDLPLAALTYVDIYSVKYKLIRQAKKHGMIRLTGHLVRCPVCVNLGKDETMEMVMSNYTNSDGFEKPLIACCGHGGKYNYNLSSFCGMNVEVNGTQVVLAKSCKNPSRRTNWDGVHYTEAANKWVFHQIKEGAFSDPPVPLRMACHRHV